MKFADVKTQVLERCAAEKACEPATVRLQAAANAQELLAILAEHFRWCALHGFTKKDFKTWFTLKLLRETPVETKLVEGVWTGHMADAIDIL